MILRFHSSPKFQKNQKSALANVHRNSLNETLGHVCSKFSNHKTPNTLTKRYRSNVFLVLSKPSVGLNTKRQDIQVFQEMQNLQAKGCTLEQLPELTLFIARTNVLVTGVSIWIYRIPEKTGRVPFQTSARERRGEAATV